MADTKITALAPIGAIDPANDVLPIVDVSNNSMAASGTTCRVTTNQLLQANAIASLASATITGDLTVDTSTLKVDSANNRVGIGTASPGSALDVRFSTNPAVDNAVPTNALRVFTSVAQAVDVGGQIGLGGLYDATTFQAFANISGKKENGTSGNNAGYLVIGTCNSLGTMAERYRIDSTGVSTWSVSGSTAMTLNSTGLGVGGSPQAKIHAIDSSGVCALFSRAAAPAAALAAVTIQAPVSSGFSSNPVLNFWFQNAGISNPASECLAIRTSSADRMYFDSTGNVISNVTGTAPTLAANSQMVFNLTSNTNLRISVRGTDGTTRTANITLA